MEERKVAEKKENRKQTRPEGKIMEPSEKSKMVEDKIRREEARIRAKLQGVYVYVCVYKVKTSQGSVHVFLHVCAVAGNVKDAQPVAGEKQKAIRLGTDQ